MIPRIAWLAVVAAGCAWALVRVAYEPVRCNAEVTELAAQTELAQATTSGYERLVRARRNLERLRRLKGSCPTAVRVPFLAAANEELMDRPADAVQSYQDALAIEQRPEIYMALAAVQIQLGQVDEGVESYVRAVQFVPALWWQIRSDEVRRRVGERVGHNG